MAQNFFVIRLGIFLVSNKRFILSSSVKSTWIFFLLAGTNQICLKTSKLAPFKLVPVAASNLLKQRAMKQLCFFNAWICFQHKIQLTTGLKRLFLKELGCFWFMIENPRKVVCDPVSALICNKFWQIYSMQMKVLLFLSREICWEVRELPLEATDCSLKREMD